MNATARLLRAANPEPPRCLGLRLRPYSLGHDIILTALDNALLQGKRDINDLLIAVFICAQPHEAWSKWCGSFWLPVFLRVWGLFLRRCNWIESFAIFEDYLQQGRSCPEVNVPVRDQRNSPATPWQQRLKLFLVMKMGLTEADALARPLALSHEDWCAAGEMEGVLNLLNDHDRAFLDFHAARCRAEQPQNN